MFQKKQFKLFICTACKNQSTNLAVAKSLFHSDSLATDVARLAVQALPHPGVGSLSARHRALGPVGVRRPHRARLEVAHLHAVVQTFAALVARHAVVARPDADATGVAAGGGAVAPLGPVLPESAILKFDYMFSF